MLRKRVSITVAVALLLCIGGYYAYRYVKFTPPAFLIRLVTAQKPPPPLPVGDIAPLVVPEGFTARIFARDLPGVRVITRDQKGTMLVSLMNDGKVVALPDADSNGVADSRITILEGLNKPHGLAVLCQDSGDDECLLYVAETNALKAYAYDANIYRAVFLRTLMTFPTDGGHYTRTILPSPEGNALLVSIGSSCNVCNEENSLRATVQEINLANGSVNVFATGLRNTVFMAYHPVTGAVWGTDNGRDLIGDDIPPDEINILERGKNYGWPMCYGNNIHDTDFDKKTYDTDPCANRTPPRLSIQAHSAALGITFIPEEGWPEEYWHDPVVALHGSWNRSEPTGYKVVRFDMLNDVMQDQFPTDFVTGFLPEGGDEDDSIGRPVDVRAEPGGILYISDDRAGAIYRISLDRPSR